LPIPILLHEKVTRGLYFIVGDHFRVLNDNSFRIAFGQVFQAYIGKLLKEFINNALIIPEIKYGRSEKSTIDWIIKDNKRAIFIEVKESCLFLRAKTIG